MPTTAMRLGVRERWATPGRPPGTAPGPDPVPPPVRRRTAHRDHANLTPTPLVSLSFRSVRNPNQLNSASVGIMTAGKVTESASGVPYQVKLITYR
ncbi:hypothetical protein Stube_03470 [Streptomyces tubercidicus]|uniref:Uncharacterized protein n=1 Tax=Streptomyces tubercidicus TaxID=47759 RepID=A0A640UK20_9ACTN|nr:hypothetical protein Stube_03470 [Streptomyces tubercidicus]